MHSGDYALADKKFRCGKFVFQIITTYNNCVVSKRKKIEKQPCYFEKKETALFFKDRIKSKANRIKSKPLKSDCPVKSTN